eukprot:18115-Heterococcus_DN1.PRE.4
MTALLLRSTLRSGIDSVAAVLLAPAAAAAAAADVGVDAVASCIPVNTSEHKQCVISMHNHTATAEE